MNELQIVHKHTSSRKVCLGRTLLFICLLLLHGLGLYAQQTVTGRVVSGDSAVANATVMVKGTNVFTQTSDKGDFSILASKGSTLVISHVSYIQQELAVPESGTVIVNMLPFEDHAMTDVVVIGYGQARKKDLTGAIVQIKPDKMADQNPNTVQDILRGTPGLMVGFDPSAKGGGSIQIRGQRSVYTAGGHNDPLLILDGMIFYGELSEINPDDIAQIDVLKDASAASIYGAKSANGVLIITTKRGQKGKPKINVTSNFGFVTMGANRNVYDPQGWMKYREDYYTADTYGINPQTGNYEAYQATSGIAAGKPGFFASPADLAKYGISVDAWRAYTTNPQGQSDDEIYARRLGLNSSDVTLRNYLARKSFDWYDQSFNPGFNQDYNISASGASDRINYYMSAGYLSNEGVVAGNKYRALRSNIKVDGKITKWLEIGANVNFQDRTDGDIAANWGVQTTVNSPFSEYRDSDGNLAVHPMGDLIALNRGYNYDFDRQYIALEKGFTVLNTIINAKVKLPFNINYSFNISPRYQWFHDRYFESTQHPDWIATTHGVNREQAKRFDWSLNNTLNWEHTFADKHRLNVTLVQEAESRQYWMDRIEARNIQPTDALGFHETSTGDRALSNFDTYDSKETADGKLARVFYAYDDRYMLTGSVRRDGYSAFGTSNPRATFYSISGAWTFTNERFFNWEPMSFGKLRVSWGQNGNRSLENPYVALANMSQGTGATQGYLNAGGNYVQYYYLSVSRLANRNLQWEKTQSFNAGLDFGFVDGRISGNVDYFIMPTIDMIMNQTLPGFSGFSSITTNLGKVENRGFEITINSQNIRTKDFSWNTSVNFSKFKNAIKNLYYVYEDVLDDNGNVIASRERSDVANRWFIGQPINAIWDYRITGIWQANEAADAALYGQRPGDPKVANNYTADDKVNSNGSTTPVYNDMDKEFLGQSNPPIMWSVRNDFDFKGINFSFNIYSYWGGKSLNNAFLNQDNSFSQITYLYNLPAKDYWTLDNPTNAYGRLNARGPSGLTAPQQLYDRSFIRLENISLGYALPRNILSRYGVEKLKVFGSIRNVAVWKKDKNWEYWDIETGTIAPRIFNLGLNLNF